jgi:hypothetical protein
MGATLYSQNGFKSSVMHEIPCPQKTDNPCPSKNYMKRMPFQKLNLTHWSYPNSLALRLPDAMMRANSYAISNLGMNLHNFGEYEILHTYT